MTRILNLFNYLLIILIKNKKEEEFKLDIFKNVPKLKEIRSL